MQLKAHPMIGAAALHHGLLSTEDLDLQPSGYRNVLVADSDWQSVPPEGLRPEVRASIDPVTDRIVGCRVQDFSSSVVRLHYRTVLSRGVVAVAGRPLGTLPETTWKPLHQRTVVALLAGAGMFVVSMIFFGAYTDRAPWFEDYGSSGPLALLGIMQALFSALFVAGLLLPRVARSFLGVKVPAAMLLGAWATMVVLWFSATPSLEGVERSIERGDLIMARMEAEAVVIEEGTSEATSAVLERIDSLEAEAERQRRQTLDQEHVARVRDAGTSIDAAREVGGTWYFDDNRVAAEEIVRRRAVIEIDRAYATADRAGLLGVARAVTPIDAGLARRSEARAALLAAKSCRLEGDYACSVDILVGWEAPPDDEESAGLYAEVEQEVEHGLHDRIQGLAVPEDASPANEKLALEKLLEDVELYTKLTEKDAPVDLAAVKKRLSKVERRIERDANKAERERKRAETQQRRRERAAARASRPKKKPSVQSTSRSRSDDRVQCCDGTTSPTCTYDRPSFRGCCSHHGGVC